MTKLALLLVLWLLSIQHLASATIIPKCTAVQALVKARINRSFISHYICIMKYESNFDTSKRTGPGSRCSYSHGIFQISSDYWCSMYRVGGICKKHCKDFLDDDIRDDIECAKQIADCAGFKKWAKFNTTCRYCQNHLSLRECEPYLSKEDLEWLNESGDEIEANGDEVYEFSGDNGDVANFQPCSAQTENYVCKRQPLPPVCPRSWGMTNGSRLWLKWRLNSLKESFSKNLSKSN